MTRSTLVRVLFVACIAAYPFIVFFGIKHLPASFFGIVLLFLLGLRYQVLLPAERPVLLPVLIIFAVYAIVAAVTQKLALLLYYPAVVNFCLAAVFLNSLRQGDPLLLRFIRARGWPISEHGPRYLYRLTAVWAGFFVLNGLTSLWTAQQGIEIWTLYNGLLSYFLVAILMLVEYIFRLYYKRSKGVSGH